MSQPSSTPGYTLRALNPSDQAWVAAFATEQWGSDRMVVRGELFLISQMGGYCVEINGAPAGLLTYRFQNDECEITSLNSLHPGLGIGSALIEAARAEALRRNCRRLHVTTTNDNLNALLFYQKRGFVLAKLRREAVMHARKNKPEIPFTGDHGLPIRDEIELEIML